jgi:hypothetical protein
MRYDGIQPRRAATMQLPATGPHQYRSILSGDCAHASFGMCSQYVRDRLRDGLGMTVLDHLLVAAEVAVAPQGWGKLKRSRPPPATAARASHQAHHLTHGAALIERDARSEIAKGRSPPQLVERQSTVR